MRARNVDDITDGWKHDFGEVLLHPRLKTAPATEFYTGPAAYLIKRRTAKKLLDTLDGEPYRDIDAHMAKHARVYVVRQPLIKVGQSDQATANEPNYDPNVGTVL